MNGLPEIKSGVQKYLDCGLHTFVIYPFGEKGMEVNRILTQCYGIKPQYIVDNNLCHYNPEIISGEELRKKYSPQMVIILAANNKGIESEILLELQEYVPIDRIFVLNRCTDLGRKADKALLSLKYLLSDHDSVEIESKENTESIKVRIVHADSSVWNSLKTVCIAFQKEPGINLLIIGGGSESESELQWQEEQVKAIGADYVGWKYYCVERDKPDILIVTHAFDYTTRIDGVENIAKLRVVMSMQVITYCSSIDDFWIYQKRGYGRYKPNMYIFDPLIYKRLRKDEIAKYNVYELGNAKFDGIYYASREGKWPCGWQKLKEKKIILWTTDHGLYNGEFTNDITFDLYAKPIFQYFRNNTDMGLIFRPHPRFIQDMLQERIWTDMDIKNLKAYCEQSENIVFDDRENYNAAYSVADAILSDPGCGIICSALPTGKPICVTLSGAANKEKEELDVSPEMVSLYYKAYNENDLYDFFQIIRNEQDEKGVLREKMINKYFKNFDGNNGVRMKDFILNKYKEVCTDSNSY